MMNLTRSGQNDQIKPGSNQIEKLVRFYKNIRIFNDFDFSSEQNQELNLIFINFFSYMYLFYKSVNYI